MPKAVEDTLQAIQSSGKSYAQAIAIAKSKGLVKQSGKHLTTGPKKKRRKLMEP